MIGKLPKELEICGKRWRIRSDFRDVLKILIALDDPDLKENEKWIIALSILYPDFTDMPQETYEEAIQKAIWFFSLGQEQEQSDGPLNHSRLYDWEKDEQYIMSAVNKVAGVEVRNIEYLHFWTFMGYFNEISDGIFSTIVSIRAKKARGIKLEPQERKFYKENRNMIDIKKISQQEQEEIDFLNKLLG